jgi:hypothetical protein
MFIQQEASRWDWLAPASRTSFRNHLIRHGMYGAGKWRRPAQQRARCIAEVFNIAVISCSARARQKASCSKVAAWSSSRGSSDGVMRELRQPWAILGDFRRIQVSSGAFRIGPAANSSQVCAIDRFGHPGQGDAKRYSGPSTSSKTMTPLD